MNKIEEFRNDNVFIIKIDVERFFTTNPDIEVISFSVVENSYTFVGLLVYKQPIKEIF